MRQSEGNRLSSAIRLSSRAKIPARQAGAELSAGIATANAVPQIVSQRDCCVEYRLRLLHFGCTDASLGEILASWPTFPPPVVQVMMALVRNSRE